MLTKGMDVILFVLVSVVGITYSERVYIEPNEQEKRVRSEAQKCLIQILTSTEPQNGTYCESTWDTIACWPATNAGQTWKIPCPDYVNGFETEGYATRTCTPNGTWYFNSKVNHTWTNYSQCIPRDKRSLLEEHVASISLLYNIGYGVSLVSLVMATVIMLMFRRLRCHRTTIHINLFASFILRATMTFLKENLLVEGVGFPGDVMKKAGGGVEFIEEGSHWECKLFFCIFYYFLGSNYMWIFVEGIYLHMLVNVAVFSEKSGIKWLIVFGWTSTIASVVPWAIVRATLEDVYCWNTHPTKGYFWIMRGQIVLSVVINFAIFINIIRVLFTKLNAFNARETKKFRYMRLAKSTLVLIPLFGVHYIVFIGLPDDVSETALLVKLYFEMGFNSFQGFIVSLIFCFFNGEVQTEIKKKWKRYRLSREQNLNGRSTRDTMTSYVSRGGRGSLVSNSNSADSKDNPHPNGNCVQELSHCEQSFTSHHKNKVYSKNGHARINTKEESLPMVQNEFSEIHETTHVL